MAGTTQVYRIHFHFEQNRNLPGGGTAQTQSGPSYSETLNAAAGDYATISGVLSANGKLRPGTLVIDMVAALPSGNMTLID